MRKPLKIGEVSTRRRTRYCIIVTLRHVCIAWINANRKHKFKYTDSTYQEAFDQAVAWLDRRTGYREDTVIYDLWLISD